MSLELNLTEAESYFHEIVYKQIAEKAQKSHQALFSEDAPFTGWVKLPEQIAESELLDIEQAASEIKKSSDTLVVIGIGGSYLGAQAALQFLSPSMKNRGLKAPEIVFAGKDFSADALSELMGYLKNREFSINVISKSGTTMESAVAFRILKNLLIEKYGEEESRKRIYVTTDGKSGRLLAYSKKMGYRRFIIPSSVGGRYSVLSAVGLLPLAVSGADIRKVINGAKEALLFLRSEPADKNPAVLYAAARNSLYAGGKFTEIFAYFEPHLSYLAEWWKQLFGESEGKEYAGIYPSSALYSTDLHSMGQYVQQGKRDLFETFIEIKNSENKVLLPYSEDDFDGLNYLAGTSLTEINLKTMRAVSSSHFDGGVPIIKISIERADEYSFGYLVYFFELSCGISGYTLGVNPFDQPGVEFYKKKMIELLTNKSKDVK
ncbi:MAG: glucose-6-phosphate isomerase [Bacillota bacterium]|nr:glucose-6-phosphate isomerase [Bacillota bacterium]